MVIVANENAPNTKTRNADALQWITVAGKITVLQLDFHTQTSSNGIP